MDTAALLPIIQKFFTELEQDAVLKQHNQDHIRRSENVKAIFHGDNLENATKDELLKLFKDTDAWSGIRGRKHFIPQLFGKSDELLPNLRELLKNLVKQVEIGLVPVDVAEIVKRLPGIGLALFSELITLLEPEKYWIWNGPVRTFFDTQQIDIKDELPHGKKGDAGEEYFLAGKYLEELRRSLAMQTDQPVNYLMTDLFIYWMNQQETSEDPWAKKIAKWVGEIEPKRLETRKEGEQRARQRIESRLGHFDEQDIRSFAQDLNSDWYGGSFHIDRFKPAFSEPQVNMLVKSINQFNQWVERIWNASDEQLDELLNNLWSTSAVYGGGITFPTALLYLKNPDHYNIWLESSTRGLQSVTGFKPGTMRTAAGYRLYNKAMIDFHARFHLTPQIIDMILWQVSSQVSENEPNDQFTGFVPDTFKFLQELQANNTDTWMHANENANMVRFKKVLQEPLRSLFTAVAPTIQEMDPGMETEAKVYKVLANIRKRFANEEGPYHSHHWGAFYRKGRTKQTDCQLFVIVLPDHINVGLSVAGEQGIKVLHRFRENLKEYPQIFLGLLHLLPSGFHIRMLLPDGWSQKPIITVNTEDINLLLESEAINIEMRFEHTDPILLTPAFADRVKTIFQSLFSLHRFTIGNKEIIENLFHGNEEGEEDGDGDEPETVERYRLEDLINDTFLPLEFWEKINLLLEDKGQIVFYGPPGTGKTWVAEKYSEYWVDKAKEPGGEVKVVQFHPSYTYEEFVEGIRPESVDGLDGIKQITYPVKPGIFRRLCDEARQHLNRRYVLIIDEINRGELPRILGELLYLLEYRKKSVELQYSGDEGQFGIPSNVFLIGTMNTADRSIALIDHALRRRFYFIPMKADPDILRSYLQDNQPEMVWVADLLTVLNKKLEDEAKIEWSLHIGHSHFMKKDLDDVRLRLIWEHSVMPTLEEYFYRKGDGYLKAFSLEAFKQALGRS